jgi:type VI secretion system protein VasG
MSWSVNDPPLIWRFRLRVTVEWMKTGHGAKMVYTDAVVDHIVDQCRDPDSGGRTVDNIITNTILPDLSRAVLTRTLDGVEFTNVRVDIGDGGFVYDIN